MIEDMNEKQTYKHIFSERMYTSSYVLVSEFG